MKSSRSIFSHHLRVVLTALLVSAVSIGGVLYYFSQQALIETIKQSLSYQADLRKEGVLTLFQEQKQWMVEVTQSAGVAQSAQELISIYTDHGLDDPLYTVTTEKFRHQYQAILGLQGVKDLFLVTPEGEQAFSMQSDNFDLGNDLTAEGFYGETVFSKLLEDVADERALVISYYGYVEQLGKSGVLIGIPIFERSNDPQSTLLGVLVRPFALQRMRDLLSNFSGLGETGVVVVAQSRFGGQGVNFISHFRDDQMGVRDEACEQTVVSSPERFSLFNALDGGSGSGWMLTSVCQPVFADWSLIPELGWGFVVRQSREEIMAPIVELRRNFMIAMVPVMLLLLWMVYGMSHTLSRPLKRLAGAADRGQIKDQPLGRLNEINSLTLSLQRMVLILEESTAVAEKATQAKDEFLASMSHELRTPLSSIIGNSELLKEREQDEDKQQIIQSIERSGRGQLALVNDILDMSKIQSGKFDIDEHPYDLSLLLTDLEQTFSTQARNIGLKFIVVQEKPEVMELLGDVQRVQQILMNLMSNGLKFTDKGEVRLTVSVQEGVLVFQVKDSGIGMSPEVLQRLFRSFQQADSSISRRFGGTGLGLYISQNLAGLMDGKIEVSSEEGVGSTFTLTLPYQQSDRPVKSTVEKEKQLVSNEQIAGHVLIAEDTPELQLLERRILEGVGVTVTVANNGEEAVELSKSHSFDLILMDMQMPVMDGIEATREIRAAGNTIPIIALTANVMQAHRDAFNAAGCDDFLGKPINRQKLLQLLKGYISEG